MAKWKTKTRAYTPKRGFVDVTLEIEVDWVEITKLLADKALASKHRKASLIHSAVKAKIIKEG